MKNTIQWTRQEYTDDIANTGVDGYETSFETGEHDDGVEGFDLAQFREAFRGILTMALREGVFGEQPDDAQVQVSVDIVSPSAIAAAVEP